MPTKQVFTVYDYHELEELIKKSYNLSSFEICSANDTDHEYDICKGEIDSFNKDIVDRCLKSKAAEDWELGTILDDMADKGFIETGEILVQVSW